uniref:Secreted protein n=1 Tax=Ditylum brightwellii TaxID=49249 RepID=A0A7S4UX80_9STRA
MNRFALALVLLFGGDLVSSYQATPNDAVMSSIVLGGDDGAMLGSSVGEELRSMFVEWVNEFEKEYPSVEEMLERMLVWVENHGELAAACLRPGVPWSFSSRFALRFSHLWR